MHHLVKMGLRVRGWRPETRNQRLEVRREDVRGRE
jgi:hypothetical protein